MIFNKTGKLVFRNFEFGNEKFEVVRKYVYLGIEISANGNFTGAIKYLCDKAVKSLGRLKKTLYSNQMDIRLHLHLFEKTIVPIFLYCCEIWGAYNIQPSKLLSHDDLSGYFKTEFDKLHLSFLKYCLGVNRKACNIAVLSETGQYPYSLIILNRVCKNWHRIVNLNQDTLLYDAYRCNCELMAAGRSQWLSSVKDTLNIIGCSDIWNNRGIDFVDYSTDMISKLLKEKFILQWKSEMKLQLLPDKKLRTYAKFKESFEFEKYLLIIRDEKVRKTFTRLRISAHNLPIEIGRHKRPAKVPLDQRLCNVCPVIGNESHYILACSKFTDARKKLFDSTTDIFTDFKNLGEEDKFLFFMKSQDIETIYLTSSFLAACMKIDGPL